MSQLSKRLPIFDLNLYDEPTRISSPPIAGKAAGEPITLMIDLYERSTAAIASTGHNSWLEQRLWAIKPDSQNILTKIV